MALVLLHRVGKLLAFNLAYFAAYTIFLTVTIERLRAQVSGKIVLVQEGAEGTIYLCMLMDLLHLLCSSCLIEVNPCSH